MPAYVIANYRVTDQEGYNAYLAGVAPTLVPFGGELIVGDFDSEAIEGNPAAVSVVVRFPDRQAARDWYDSQAYRAVRDFRIENTEGFLLLADGMPDESAQAG